ncbi:UDP-N-acetylglucosamine 2-epimerase [Erythrobacter sp. Alg231-14]|uniref:UDP-N-acetylglucosamine 2-epimerase n=1 Tax=Erythrobacter sp. Alg231-14 TaxID=1922225 RepID=UPI000D55DC64
MKIDYLTGSRADFGLMLPCLRALHDAPDFDCRIVVTGQHLAPGYGNTIKDIEHSGLPIAARIAVPLTGADGGEMALALAAELDALTRFWRDDRPDAVMLLGDRGEMLAGALAALHLAIPIVHVGGGERSGTLDESFRHAITKLAHVHLCSTDISADRIVRMGERADCVTAIGAPGLVGIHSHAMGTFDFAGKCGFAPTASGGPKVAVVIYHPVVQESATAAQQAEAVIAAVRDAGFSQLILRPNSDAGGKAIDAMLDRYAGDERVCVVDHLARPDYLSAIRCADLLVGNSSSGIIESASLSTPCLNIGARQSGRERNANTVDCESTDPAALANGIERALSITPSNANIYGDGTADARLVAALRSADFGPHLLSKINTY